MNAEFIQTLTFQDNFGSMHVVGSTKFNPFELKETFHFGQHSCLVGISLKSDSEENINAIKFHHKEFVKTDSLISCGHEEKDPKSTAVITISIVLMAILALTISYLMTRKCKDSRHRS